MKLDFDVNNSIKKIKKSSTYFHTFINKPSLAAGVLVLKPGEEVGITTKDQKLDVVANSSSCSGNGS